MTGGGDVEDAIAWNLARLNTAFIHHYDRREYDQVLAMFTPDAVYEVRGRALHGHGDIRAALDARPGPELIVRHLVTNQPPTATAGLGRWPWPHRRR